MGNHRHFAPHWALLFGLLATASCAELNGSGQEIDDAGHLAPRQVDSWQKIVERHAPTVAQISQLPWLADVFGVELSREALAAHYDGGFLPGKRVPDPVELTPEQIDERDSFLSAALGFYSFMQPSSVHFAEHVPPHERDAVVRHELMHALQDQHYDLKALKLRASELGPEATLALQAVLEGQACAVEAGWQAPTVFRPRNPRLDGDALFNGRRTQAPATQAGHAPSPVQATLALTQEYYATFGPLLPPTALQLMYREFPYPVGLSFVETLAQHSSLPAAIRMTLERPPISTREVLHPEVYLRGEIPEALPVEALRAAWGRPQAAELTVGELHSAILLGAKEAAFAVAEGWRGDVMLVDEKRQEQVWVSFWRDAAAAQDFVDALDAAERAYSEQADPDLQMFSGDQQTSPVPDEVSCRRLGRAVLSVKGRPNTTQGTIAAVSRGLDPMFVAAQTP